MSISTCIATTSTQLSTVAEIRHPDTQTIKLSQIEGYKNRKKNSVFWRLKGGIPSPLFGICAASGVTGNDILALIDEV